MNPGLLSSATPEAGRRMSCRALADYAVECAALPPAVERLTYQILATTPGLMRASLQELLPGETRCVSLDVRGCSETHRTSGVHLCGWPRGAAAK